MKNKFLLLSIAIISVASIFSCKDEEETNTTAPSLIGTWEMNKVNLKIYVAGTKFMDTVITTSASSTRIAIIKEDKSIMLIDTQGGKKDTSTGTYSVDGTKFILNLVHPVNGPSTDEYENLSYNSTDLSFTAYDPDKTSASRTEYTAYFKRK